MCAWVIAFLVNKGLLPPEAARMLRGWVHSGFNVHRGRRVLSRERERRRENREDRSV